MKKLALLPFLIAGLHGQETHNVLPQAASDWKQAGPGSFTLTESISTAKGGFKALPPKANS